jgi:hypothetical protein
VSRLGTCPTCMGLCAACLALGLLVYGLGENSGLFLLTAVGMAGAAVAGPLLMLHGLFYLRRRNTLSAPPHRNRLHPVVDHSQARSSCCGPWG